MSKRNLYFLLIVILVGVLLLVLGDDDFQQKWIVDTPLSTNPGSPTVQGDSTTTPQGDGSPTAANDPSDAGRVSVAFTQWFENQARDMEKSSIDPKAKEIELKAAAQKLTPPEVQFLKERSVNMKDAANNRILAVYVMTLAPDVTGEALLEVAQAPLVMQGEHPVHSPEETLAAQEKSLRRMAIDALIEQARSNPDRRTALKTAIGQITDPSLREYAEKKLR
ncbi:hypothetical protein [Bdellovibrio bacteriovorus]|uniref:hypothetical protein n=1 Tax=Bdellovibrio TaxID=958 RepID=UPI0035A87579